MPRSLNIGKRARATFERRLLSRCDGIAVDASVDLLSGTVDRLLGLLDDFGRVAADFVSVNPDRGVSIG